MGNYTDLETLKTVSDLFRPKRSRHKRSHVPLSSQVQVGVYNQPTDTVPALQWQQAFGTKNADTGFVDANGKASSISYVSTPSPYLPGTETNRNNETSTVTYDTTNTYGNALTAQDNRGARQTFQYQYPSDFPLGQIASVQASHIGAGGTADNTRQATTFDYYGPSDGVVNGLLHDVYSPVPGTVGGTSTVTTTYTYDTLGNVTLATMPGANGLVTVTYNYTSGYGGFSQTEALGEPLTVTVTGPNPSGTTPANVSTTTYFLYDGRGNRTAVIDALGNRTDFAYNLADQMTTTTYPHTGDTDPAGASGTGRAFMQAAYQYPGGSVNTVSVYDEGNQGLVRRTTSVYGHEGEPLSVSDLKGLLSSSQYDGLYRVTTVQDGQNNATLYSYDPVGNLFQVRYPNAAGTTAGSADTLTYTYDPDQNLTGEVNGNGVQKAYQRYDPTTQTPDSTSLVRTIHYTYPSGYAGTQIADVQFQYDGYGRRIGLSDGTGGKTYTYDDLDDPLSQVMSFTGGPQNQTFSYAYYPNGSRQQITVPNVNSGLGVRNLYTYQYDGVGRLLVTGFPWQGGNSTATYQANNWLSKVTGPKYTTTYGYNHRGQMSSLINTLKNYPNSPTQDLAVSTYLPIKYDAVGNRVLEQASIPKNPNISGSGAPDASHIRTFQYDTRDELLQEQSTLTGSGSAVYNPNYSSGVYTYGFSFDNALNLTQFENTTGLTYNLDNQFTINGFAYDGQGNPSTYMADSTFSFDPEDRLTAIGSKAFSSRYDGDGLRAWKTAPNNSNVSTTTYFLNDLDGTPLLEETYSGTTATVSAANGPGVDGWRSRFYPSNNLYYQFTYDPEGNLVQRQNGALVGPSNTSAPALDTAEYNAFGAKAADVSFSGGAAPRFDPIGFGGQWGYYTDTETGLVNLTHRYYDPTAGRFLTRDPIGYSGGINLYGFAGNNPVNRQDPSGLQAPAPRVPEEDYESAAMREYARFAEEDFEDTEETLERDREEFLNRGNKPIIRSFPEWQPGAPITQLTPDGKSPEWYARAAPAKPYTVQGRYWINRALAANGTGEFSDAQLRSMQLGFAPKARVLVRSLKTGMIEVREESKELHHAAGRNFPGSNNPRNLYEVWPWEHARIDSDRHTGYVFIKFAPLNK